MKEIISQEMYKGILITYEKVPYMNGNFGLTGNAWDGSFYPEDGDDYDDVKTCSIDMIKEIDNFFNKTPKNYSQLTDLLNAYRTSDRDLKEEVVAVLVGNFINHQQKTEK